MQLRSRCRSRNCTRATRSPIAVSATSFSNRRPSATAASSSNSEFASLGKFALASVYRGEKKDAQAIDLYKQLINKPTELVSKVSAQLELASLYESEQKPDDAKKIYQDIQKDNPKSEAASLAQRKLSDLK